VDAANQIVWRKLTVPSKTLLILMCAPTPRTTWTSKKCLKVKLGWLQSNRSLKFQWCFSFSTWWVLVFQYTRLCSLFNSRLVHSSNSSRLTNSLSLLRTKMLACLGPSYSTLRQTFCRSALVFINSAIWVSFQFNLLIGRAFSHPRMLSKQIKCYSDWSY